MDELQIEFNYQQLDQSTASFLRNKENNMKNIVDKAYTDLGKELKESQDELAKHGYGCFGKWYESLGFKSTTVKNLINRYKLISQNLTNQNLIEELPKSLTYEIAKPSANEELKQRVLDGEVKTLKEFKELENKINLLEQNNNKLGQLLTEERNKPVKEVVVEKEKVVDRTDYNKINQLENELNTYRSKLTNIENQKQLLQERLQQEEEDATEYNKLKEELQRLHSQKDDLHRQIDSATSISRLYVNIEDLLQNSLAPIKYSRAITECRDSEVAMSNLKEIIQMVDGWSEEMKSYLPNKNNNYIDAEVIEYE